MKCRICGLDCPPASKICRDCASARKRAFAATVTLPLLAAVGAPSISEPRFIPKPTRPRAARAADDYPAERRPPAPRNEAALPLTVVPRKHGLVWFAVAALIIVGVLIAIVRTAGDGNHVTDEVVAKPQPAAAVAEALPPSPKVVTDTAPAPPVAEALPPKSTVTRPPRKAVPHVESAPVAAEPTPAPEAQPVGKAPPPPRTVEVPRADPGQALSEGLAQCARQGLLERMGCEQRIRSQYCGNSWGLVPQCPIGRATDHGQ